MKLEEAVGRAVVGDGVVIGLDFDGTLAPLVDHPSIARPTQGVIDILSRLAAKPGVRVVVISGRSRTDLLARLGEVPGVVMVGEHGNDHGGSETVSPEIGEAVELVEDLAAGLDGSVVEIKPSSVALHYRRSPASGARQAVERIRDWAGERQGVRILEGKEVIELTVATRTKGDFIGEIADGTPIIYVGDDMTDETVFAMLGPDDVGVKVGEGPTGARYRVADTGAVLSLLETVDLALG